MTFRRLLLVGCGNMAGAMLRRWLATGLDPATVTAVSPGGRAMPEGVRVVRSVPDEAFDLVMLGMKPQQLASVAAGPLASLAPRVLVSILAGVDIATLRGVCRAEAVARAMPNLPVELGQGVVALHAYDADAPTRGALVDLMAPLGLVEWIADEARFDLVTALAGSGPAFLYRFVDALARAGEALGLGAEQAARLALATVAGSAALASRSGDDPAMLADRVASPGGSTRKGLDVLDADDALVRLLTETLAASERRNAELATLARA